MSPTRIVWQSAAAGLLSLLVLAGCGGGQPSADARTAQDQTSSAASGPRGGLPTASIRGAAAQNREAAPSQGSGEWLLAQVREVRAQAFPETDDVAVLAAERRERNTEIVRLATEAIARTHHDAAKEDVFTEAVRQLMEARLQLALQGERDEIDALYDDAASLQERAPESRAAAEAAFARARFAHANAVRYANQDQRWLEEFARQARRFAADFPDEEVRAVPLLFSAGLSCDLHRMTEQAIGCYDVLTQQFPETPQGRQAAAALRRLQLPGRSLQLGGPTRDGGYVSVEELRGKLVLVAFWSSDSPRFLEALPHVSEVVRRYERHGLTLLGVNLDADEQALDAFLDEQELPGVHIFPADPDQRRWDNPVVRHYGVRDIPTLWLVDRDGTVVDVMVDPATLDAQVRSLLSRREKE